MNARKVCKKSTLFTGQREVIKRVEGDEVGNAHIHQLLQSKCAVERFTFGALMLSSFINERLSLIHI